MKKYNSPRDQLEETRSQNERIAAQLHERRFKAEQPIHVKLDKARSLSDKK